MVSFSLRKPESHFKSTTRFDNKLNACLLKIDCDGDYLTGKKE